MMATRRKVMSREQPPPPMVELNRGRLLPVTPYDAEMMASFAAGTQFDLIERRRRSHPQLRLYWKILHEACKATDRWPRATNLHRDLKLTLGYVSMAYDMQTRKVVRVPDSTDFESMSQADFNVYFERAMGVLGREIGCDPFDLVDGAGR